MVAKNVKYLKNIENNLANVQQGKSVDRNLEELASNINKLYGNTGATCKSVKLRNSMDEVKFFGMSIFPDSAFIDRESRSVFGQELPKQFDKTTRVVSGYHIIIDDKLLHMKELNATPRQLTAVILHEIGHIIYTDEVLDEFDRMNTLKRGVTNPATVVMGGIFSRGNVGTFAATMLGLLMIDVYMVYSLNLLLQNIEIRSDSHAVELGYRDDLYQILDKVKSLKEAQHMRSKATRRILLDTGYSEKGMLEKRLSVLRQIQNESTSLHWMYELYDNRLVESIEPAYKDLISPKYNMLIENSLKEKIKKVVDMGIFGPSLPSRALRRDIDKIKLDIQSIEDVDDKYYIIDSITSLRIKVYNGLEWYGISKVDIHPKMPTEKELKEADKELEKMQQKVIDIKIPEERYGLFVKYPVGYEG